MVKVIFIVYYFYSYYLFIHQPFFVFLGFFIYILHTAIEIRQYCTASVSTGYRVIISRHPDSFYRHLAPIPHSLNTEQYFRFTRSGFLYVTNTFIKPVRVAIDTS